MILWMAGMVLGFVIGYMIATIAFRKWTRHD